MMTTITYEQLQAILQAPCTDTRNAALADAGIAIAPPEPPEGMVKLAREIAAEAQQPGPHEWPVAAALAALQFADKVVREAECPYGRVDAQHAVSEYKRVLRRKLGAIA